MLNTLAHILHVSKGSQSVLYDPTVVHAYGYKGDPCIRKHNLSEKVSDSYAR